MLNTNLTMSCNFSNNFQLLCFIITKYPHSLIFRLRLKEVIEINFPFPHLNSLAALARQWMKNCSVCKIVAFFFCSTFLQIIMLPLFVGKTVERKIRLYINRKIPFATIYKDIQTDTQAYVSAHVFLKYLLHKYTKHSRLRAAFCSFSFLLLPVIFFFRFSCAGLDVSNSKSNPYLSFPLYLQ